MTVSQLVQLTHDMVEIVELEKKFGSFDALKSVSLNVRKGEFFSLLGPSGCGKTTLLRIIGGFERPSNGSVTVAGNAVQTGVSRTRRTNMVFQHHALFPHMTVGENISFGLEMRRQSKPEIRKRVADVLRLVRLPGLENRKVTEISGGQRQRVAVARAIVNDPAVLLLDEPLGALDLQLRLQMQEELKQLQAALKSTFIFVTHDQAEAMTMSDRIAVMSNGEILQIGTPKEVYERPVHRFVAEFIGHSNFLSGRMVGRSADGISSIEYNGRLLQGIATQSISPGSEAILCLKYEKLRIVPRDSEEGIPVRVEKVNFTGPTVRLVTRAEDTTSFVVDLHSGQEIPQVSEAVRIIWSPQDCVVVSAT